MLNLNLEEGERDSREQPHRRTDNSNNFASGL